MTTSPDTTVEAAATKPFVTPENMSRIIQHWFQGSPEATVLITDDVAATGDEVNIKGIGFSLTEFLSMLRKFDSLSSPVSADGRGVPIGMHMIEGSVGKCSRCGLGGAALFRPCTSISDGQMYGTSLPQSVPTPVSVADGWKRTESLSVAVYWPKEGSYGIPTRCNSMVEAENRAASDWALGYGCGAQNSGLIHIIKTVREVREWKGTE